MNTILNRSALYPELIWKLNSPDRRKMSKMSNNDSSPIIFNSKNPIDRVSFTSSKTGSKLNYMA